MSRKQTGIIPTHNPSTVLGIQFSILSPDEIRRASVAEITSRDTTVGGKPVFNGLNDPRQGVQEPGLICPTDGLDYMHTPGYPGHIELARPLYYIQYLNTVMKVLRCTCMKCSKLLIGKEKNKHLLKLSADERWQQVFTLASKIKRCGDDNEDGCGAKQPAKIRKDGLATVIAEWESIEGVPAEDTDALSVKVTGEMALKILRRISDEDVAFMGFSPIWSRPDWMICEVFSVPPPAVRPSVKHDSQQRSEDDITHILVNIIRANTTLRDKIKQNAAANVIDDWTTVLQYYVATMIDNKIPGVASVAQRSGRPLKSMKERINGKGGRVRGNLMGKRVDFSARSVITPDANLSIRQLGVPMKVAKNITKPVKVTPVNRQFLMKLIQNGPDVHPGAKVLERVNGDNISLRYIDRSSIRLEIGDIVHRHMMDGDAVLFNRQPTLHRMSMMCHIAKIMPVGDTFRMNVGDTKPYNADFDGDEMNLHMPQSLEAENELECLAAVPYQIVSPANNKPIVGIFQDSLLGAYRFTRQGISFSTRDAMNLLMAFDRVNPEVFQKSGVDNFELLTQILPPLSLTYKTNKFKDGHDFKTSNAVIEIKNGEYIRGQMEKSVLGDSGRGLIHRVCNNYGNMSAARFIDDLQNVITEYMKSSAYSVGISDLIANAATNQSIADIITEKKKEVGGLIDETHLGIFENKTGKTNEEEFERRVNNILNQASMQAGRVGLKSLSEDNRFVIMVNAGSKGSELNIAQMISCLGQQNVDGKRIPYGFEGRTLPHFTRYDDRPGSRGFVESSFIGGLTPEELFFHAMGGRVGLIDTAVKTSQTGYIQRRLVKGLEDLEVAYDTTVRNSKGKVIQFAYGDDNIDPVRVENQPMPLVRMSTEEIYSHFYVPSTSGEDNFWSVAFTSDALKRMRKQKANLDTKCKEMTNMMLEGRKLLVDKVFKNRDNRTVHCPVAFAYLIDDVQGQQRITPSSMVDITPLEAYVLIESKYQELQNIGMCPPTKLFSLLYYYHLSPASLLIVKRFNKTALITLLEMIILTYKKALVAPGEMVGMIAAQSIGEPTTQMTLNTFHFAGVASKSNVTRGVPRIEEILSLSENPKNPSCTVYLREEEEQNKDYAQATMHRLEHTKLREVVTAISICFDPDDLNTLIDEDRDLMEQYKVFENLIDECAGTDSDESEKSKWIVRMELNIEAMLDRNITMDDIHFALKNAYNDDISCAYSDYNADKLVFRIRLNSMLAGKKKTTKVNPLDQADEIYILKGFQDQLLDNVVLRGVRGIDKVILRKVMDGLYERDGSFEREESWVLDTVGTNLMGLLALDYIDTKRTCTNDIQEVYRVLGIEAARQAIFNEIAEVIEFDGTYINYHHLSILCDRMTCNSKMVSIFRHGINNDNIGPIAKASFEETPEMFLKAARHGELDIMRGVSANVMCGQEGYFGTGSFQVMLDTDLMAEQEAIEQWVEDDHSQKITDGFGKLEDPTDACSTSVLTVPSNVANISQADFGDDTDYDPGF
jgi:DNA-directed RNA polymerase II subunit RPB1